MLKFPKVPQKKKKMIQSLEIIETKQNKQIYDFTIEKCNKKEIKKKDWLPLVKIAIAIVEPMVKIH